MLKKIAIFLFVLILILVALQLWGGRDFTQISLAWQKYDNQPKIAVLLNDIWVILKGDKVKDSFIPAEEMNKIYFKWIDKHGVVKYSDQRPPDVKEYEEISIKDLPFNVQPSIYEEQRRSEEQRKKTGK